MLSLAALLLSTQTALAGAKASGFKKDTRKAANHWNAVSAIDGNLETAWMVNGESENIGEWIMIDAPNSYSTLNEIKIVNGFAKSEETYKDYARIKSAKLEVLQYDSNMELQPTNKFIELNLEDKIEAQIIKLKAPLKLESETGGAYKLTVTGIYEGKDYPNFALSELVLYLNDFDVNPQITEVENGVDGSEELDLIDNKTSSYWLGQENAKIGVEANGAAISRIGITPVRGKSYARPKKVKVSIGSRSNVLEMADNGKQQWVWVPTTTGYPGGSSWDTIFVEVLETYPGKKSKNVGIAEIDTKASSLD